MLSALRRRPGPAALSARRADQARDPGDRRPGGAGVATKAHSQDLCFLAGEGKRAASWLGTRRLVGPPGEIVDEREGVIGRHRGHHEYTVGQRRGLGVAAGVPLYVLATESRSPTGWWRARARSWPPGPSGCATVSLRRDGARVDRVKLRYRARPLSCSDGGRRRPRMPGWRYGLDQPAYGVAPRSDRLPDGRRDDHRPCDDRSLDYVRRGRQPRFAKPISRSSSAEGTGACRRRR